MVCRLKLFSIRNCPVVLRLVIHTGSVADPAGKAGMAVLTSDMLDEGRPHGMRCRFRGLGEHRAGFGASAAGMLLPGIEVLTRHLDAALSMFADVLLNPAFPENEFDRIKKTI